MSRARTLGQALAAAPWWAPVVLVLAVFALVCWASLQRLGPATAFDSGAFIAYADQLDATGRLPSEGQNYEYSLPPGWPMAGAYAQRVADALPSLDRPLAGVPSSVRRLGWLALVVFALAAATLVRVPRAPVIGATAGAVAAAWAAWHVLGAVSDATWLAKPSLTLGAELVLVALTALLARELWPDWRHGPALGALAVAALPVVPRMALFFHPDPPFAALAAGGTLVVLRASRRAWPPLLGVWAGALLGLTALVRQSGVVVTVALGVGVLLAARHKALGFLAAVAAAVALVAGPWWAYQAHRFGNPVESNLDRPGYMLEHQPVSFFVSVPPDVVLRPYRESFKNELGPKLHAELWSDWFGGLHDWQRPSRADKVIASTQSALGFGGDALVLGGLLGVALPAAIRVLRRVRASEEDSRRAILFSLVALSFVAFVATLVRFPQADGDPIKSSYLLFLAPAAALLGLETGRRVWAHGGVWRAALLGWVALYGVSYAALLATSP